MAVRPVSARSGSCAPGPRARRKGERERQHPRSLLQWTSTPLLSALAAVRNGTALRAAPRLSMLPDSEARSWQQHGPVGPVLYTGGSREAQGSCKVRSDKARLLLRVFRNGDDGHQIRHGSILMRVRRSRDLSEKRTGYHNQYQLPSLLGTFPNMGHQRQYQ